MTKSEELKKKLLEIKNKCVPLLRVKDVARRTRPVPR